MSPSQEKFYNVKILRDYESYLRQHLGWKQAQIDELFQSIGSDSSFIGSGDNWFDQDYADQFYRTLVQITGDQNLAFNVGKYTTNAQARGLSGSIIQGILYPQILFANIQRFAKLYTKGSFYTPIKVTRTDAIIRSTPVEGCTERYYQCQNRMGILKALPAFFNCRSVTIRHDVCYHKGSPYCEYSIKWENPWSHRPFITSFAVALLVLAASLFFADYSVGLKFASFTFAIFYLGLQKMVAGKLESTLGAQNTALEESVTTLNRRHQETLVVRNFMEATTEIIPLKELVNKGANLIRNSMKYDRTMVLLVDSEKNVLRPEALCGYSDDVLEIINTAEFQIREDNTSGFLISVVNTKQPLFIRDVKSQIHKLSNRSQKLIQLMGIESLIVVPIIFQDKVLGVVAIENTRVDFPLTANDLEMLQGVADHFAVAITNVINYEQTNRSLEMIKKAEKQEKVLREIFQKYVPTEIVDEPTISATSLTLRREILSVMFVDLISFTAICEKKFPEEIADILNIYIEVVNESVRKFGGRINKIIGDGLFIYFPTRESNCLAAGYEILKSVAVINQRLADNKHDPISVGIGAHRGVCTLGNIGYSERVDYTLIGDAVNIAARVESYTRQVGPNSFCFTEELLHEANEYEYVEKGTISLKGRKAPVNIYVLTGKNTSPTVKVA